MYKTILITGASSGLGEAFALSYAAPNITLFLTGRNQTRLEAVAAQCRSKGATVDARVIDASHRQDMTNFIQEIAAQYPLDLVIANAGISSGTNLDNPDSDYTIFDTNLGGVLNTILPAIPSMIGKKNGHLVIISSLAGIVPLPSAPAYSASKAAVRFYGEALRPKLSQYGIKVSVICPGFVVSRMTDANTFKMPFLMQTAQAVDYMMDKIQKGSERIIFPWPLRLMMGLLSILPDRLLGFILKNLPNKG